MVGEEELHPEVRATARRIAAMETRGAAAIADAAAAALGAQAAGGDAETPEALRAEIRAAARTLYDTRPTAVSLPNALRYVLAALDEEGRRGETAAGRAARREALDREPGEETVEELRSAVERRVETFREDLAAAQDRLGRIGAGRLSDGDVVMTHCHSTDAMACIEAAVAEGTDLEAVVNETRPRKQGHITARQLRELDVPVTLAVDNAAHALLDGVDHLLVGADSISADGSVVNKVGTAGLAVSARDRGVPVMVAAQSVKLHPASLSGAAVEIEERPAEEVIEPSEREAIGDVDVVNPAFDVTPPRHVDAIVTEHGQFPPESVVVLMRELFGESVDEPWTEP